MHYPGRAGARHSLSPIEAKSGAVMEINRAVDKKFHQAV
jgi:hypothetical protein